MGIGAVLDQKTRLHLFAGGAKDISLDERIFFGKLLGKKVSFIGFHAGVSDEDRRDFVGLDEPPPITDERGKRFVLKSNSLGSLGVGAPVYYRRLPVGQVVAYTLSPDGKSVEITVFVEAPYDDFVTSESRSLYSAATTFCR
jgi:paraquat-inducible protein B